MHNHHQRPPAMEAARKMPPLSHFVRGEPFDIMRSKAAEWLSRQPEIRQWLWNIAKKHGSIILDLENHVWHGADHRP